MSDGRWIGRTVLAGVVIAVVLPLVPLALYSFAGRWLYPDLLPAEWSLRAWEYVLRPRSMVLEATLTSLAVAVSVTGICVLLGVPAGRGLAVLTPGLRSTVELLFFAPI
ncbi:MAG: ABC transporter permease, partial [Spirochaetota bacterium]